MTADVHVVCSNVDCALRFPAPADTRCPLCGSATAVVASRTLNVPLRRIPRRQLALIFDNVRSAHNVGVMLRTAECIGASHVYHCGITAPPLHPKVAKAALGSEQRVVASVHRNAVALVAQLQADGVVCWALESVAAADDIFEAAADAPAGLALVVGNEVAGVDPAVLELCTRRVTLPMVGDKNSLNVGHAFAAAAYVLAFS